MFWPFLVIFLVFAQTQIYAETECSCRLSRRYPYDTKPFQYDRNWYFTLNRRVDFMQARRMCERTESQLIMFHSVSEMKSVVASIACPTECPDWCGFKRCSPCNSTVCPVQESISYWINAYGGKYVRQDFKNIDIPPEFFNNYFYPLEHDQAIIYSRKEIFLSYDPSYRAQPFCKINCLRRKNANDLHNYEVNELQNAMFDISRDRSFWNLDNLIMTYRFNCREHAFLYDQNSNVFFHWTRLFILNFEHLLQRKLNSPIGVPYWDWMVQSLPKLVVEKTFRDRSGKTRRNLFRGIPDNTKTYSSTSLPFRNPNLEKDLKAAKCQMWGDLRVALTLNKFCNFLQQYYFVISRILAIVGGNQPFSICNPVYAVYDPLLFLIFSNVDRHFVMWRKLRIAQGLNPNIKVCRRPDIRQHYLEPFHTKLIANRIIRQHAKPTLVDSHAHLYYKYDTKELSAYSKELNKACGITNHKRNLWLKIVFFENLSCSARISIFITLPPRSASQQHKVLYTDTLYIVNHLHLVKSRKFTVYKDVTHLMDDQKTLQQLSQVHIIFRYPKTCRRRRNLDNLAYFVKGE